MKYLITYSGPHNGKLIFDMDGKIVSGPTDKISHEEYRELYKCSTEGLIELTNKKVIFPIKYINTSKENPSIFDLMISKGLDRGAFIINVFIDKQWMYLCTLNVSPRSDSFIHSAVKLAGYEKIKHAVLKLSRTVSLENLCGVYQMYNENRIHVERVS